MISIATLEDVTALEQLVNSAYRGETSKQGWTTEAHLLKGKRITTDELIQIIENPENTVLKFSQNKDLVGCVLLVNKTNKLYLGMLTVSPQLQNSSIGKQLLKEAENHAASLGLSKIVMTVISVREELIAWYKRQGYVDTGKTEPFPLDNPNTKVVGNPLEFIVMEKIL